jgi:hypothetical protein
MQRTWLVALASCGALLPSPASAQQFTFVVPVEVRNLPSNIDRMNINCTLYYGTPLRTIGERRTYGSTQITIPQVPGPTGGTVGQFIGEVTVDHNVMPGFDPTLVTHYWCTMNFQGSEGGAGVTYFDVTRPDESPRFPVADGAALRVETGVQPLPR